MQNYKESLSYNYFVGTGAVLTDATKTTADLVPLQIGLFNSQTYKALAVGTSASSVREIIIAQGSPNPDKIGWTNSSVSTKSVPIQAGKLIAYRKSLPQRPQNQIVTIGWDGVTDCKTITAECGKTYSLFVQVEGSPVSRFFGAKPLTETYTYTFSSCGGDDCVAFPENMVDYFVKAINASQTISPFVKAEKIVAYSTPPSVDKTTFKKFTLTIADDGSIQNLAALQAAYPGLGVTLESRDGIFSTYSLVQVGTDPDPDPYSTSNVVTIKGCPGECPSGYTLTGEDVKYKFFITRADDGSSTALTAIHTDYDAYIEASTVVRLVFANGVSTYEARGSSATTPITNAVSGDTVVLVDTITPVCVLTSAVEVPWVKSSITPYKVKKTLCLVVGDEECDTDGSNTLAALEAQYADNPMVVDSSLAQDTDGSCANSFTIEIYSDLVLEDECETGIPTFGTLDPYKGFHWTECPCDTVTGNAIDNIGIKLVGGYVDTKFGKCSFQYDDFVELDIPKITVRQNTPSIWDNADECVEQWPVTLIQAPKYPTGTGETVLRDYIENMSFKGQHYTDDKRWREIYGYNYDFIDTSKFFKFYYLEFEAIDKYNKNLGYGGMDIRTTLTFAFPEEADTTDFENVLEGWIISARPDLVSSDHTGNLYR